MASVDADVDYAEALLSALTEVQGDFSAGELAYLALTSKVELPVRDRLAFRLSQQLPEGLFVAREWRRVDLAVLEEGPEALPRMLLEAKALYSFDLVGPPKWATRYPDLVERDVAKLRAMGSMPVDVQAFVLVLATHPVTEISASLRHIAKYATGVAKAVQLMGDPDAVAAEARQRLLGHLRALGPVREGKMNGGTAYGVEINVLYWLFGPIPLTSIERDARSVRSG